ncbi:GntR family transcriptional regulator [Sediminibacillus halophilus]|uniref:GntR family transcriptional regulator, arabinose operon transcriptional repressor n=1 Tax=Sediminibacillus halophilus TaxID=482461 RepID=A0A1G9TIJ2_9BACI|nr:GntR family transcriptional regulator [Sediminibacillus halophilus]SDM47284.1 GntR family transcriptional regulator, arabinose operon transcriptional repressor [Sediminibacillus halophilus]
MQTKHSMVKQAIKSKILDGTYQPNQKISSESELMKQFNVSRHTVRLAIGDLVNQGWLYREQGAGTFCADRSKLEGKDSVGQKNIAIITTYISDYIFPSIIRGAESYLSDKGYNVSLFSTNNNHQNEKEILEKLLTQKYDGVIVEPTQSAFSNPNINLYLNLERLNIPYLMINAFYEELEPLYIVMDDEKGGYIQTEYLINQGHTNIVGFFKTDDLQGIKRMKGFIKAHRANRLQVNPQNIITYSTEEKRSKPSNELESILAAPGDRPSALVCYNDELALNILDVLRTRMLSVPENISIVGYDDSILAQLSEVKLTTIAHPKSKMGEKAAQVILDLIDVQGARKKMDADSISSVVYEPELVERNSTKNLQIVKG